MTIQKDMPFGEFRYDFKRLGIASLSTTAALIRYFLT